MLPTSDRLENLLDEIEEGIGNNCVQDNRGTDPGIFRVSRSVITKLISLMHGVKDINRVQERIEFPISIGVIAETYGSISPRSMQEVSKEERL